MRHHVHGGPSTIALLMITIFFMNFRFRESEVSGKDEGDSNLAKISNLIFFYFLGQIQNHLDIDVWKNAKKNLIRPL